MAEADLPQSSTPQLMTLNGTPPEVVVSNATTPEEVPTPVKKPRKPRPPKIVAKLATVTEGVAEQRTGGSASGSENSTSGPSSDVADVELRPSKEPQLPLEFWTGLMQTQKVIMATRKSDHYNSFRIV